jgi:hypothetical protein
MQLIYHRAQSAAQRIAPSQRRRASARPCPDYLSAQSSRPHWSTPYGCRAGSAAVNCDHGEPHASAQRPSVTLYKKTRKRPLPVGLFSAFPRPDLLQLPYYHAHRLCKPSSLDHHPPAPAASIVQADYPPRCSSAAPTMVSPIGTTTCPTSPSPNPNPSPSPAGHVPHHLSRPEHAHVREGQVERTLLCPINDGPFLSGPPRFTRQCCIHRH